MTCLLFAGIGFAAWWKKQALKDNLENASPPSVVVAEEIFQPVEAPPPAPPPLPQTAPKPVRPLPHADRIRELFNVHSPKFPFVNTIVYKSRAEWIPDRPAWIVDYASRYKTSTHFLARSLNNNRPDYNVPNVSEGNRFNVLAIDRPLEFLLVIDLSRCHLWFYCYDSESDERWLIKDYPVGLGRLDPSTPSGCLTPLGTFTLGSRVASYAPKAYGWHKGERTELVTVFGTRWIPFDEEIGECSDSARGYGIHGLPLLYDERRQNYVESTEGLEGYESDGCIRMRSTDVEELYAVIVSRPTTLFLVRDFFDAVLPGKETEHSTR